jgi:uncharacterized protein YrrD
MKERGTPIAWNVLAKGTPVYAADGAELGKVADVIADDQKDIFSGISLKPGLFKEERFVPADLIEQMTDAAVRLSISAAQAHRQLEPHER